MRIGRQRAIDWTLLAQLGEAERARAVVGHDTPWSRMFDAAFLPSYRLLTVEFLSTFRYRRPRPADAQDADDDDDEPQPDIEFTLCGHDYHMTIQRFGQLCGFYHEPETVQPMFTEGLTAGEDGVLRGWWFPAISTEPFIGHRCRVSTIRDPLVRYLHRCIATSISARASSQEWVTTRDLFYLHCLMTGTPCNLARCLALYFASFYHRQQRGTIFGGAFITHIARSSGLIQQIHDLQAMQPARLDRRTVIGMSIAAVFPGVGLRFSLQPGVIWHPQPVAAQPAQPVAAQPQHPEHQEQGQEQGQGQEEEQEQAQAQAPDQPAEHQDEPPQHPQHVYRAVRLTDPLETLLHRIDQTTRDIVEAIQIQARRLDRLEDTMQWHTRVALERARRDGTELPPFPHPDAGSSSRPDEGS